MENLVIVGSSGHAKVVIDVVEREGRYRIVGLLDRFRRRGEETLGYPVLGQEEDLAQLRSRHELAGALVAIGDNHVRATVVSQIRAACPDLPFVRAVHPRANIARQVELGEGAVVMAGASVGPGCSVGAFCIVNTNASLDHDSIMGEFASLAPRASTGGNCRIGAHSAIGIGAVVLQGVTIGEQTVLGASATALHDIASFTVAYGTPARSIRTRGPGDDYLKRTR